MVGQELPEPDACGHRIRPVVSYPLGASQQALMDEARSSHLYAYAKVVSSSRYTFVKSRFNF